MRHESLPVTMSPEQLADYIKSNRVETLNHVEKITLTDDDKAKLAMDSSLASRALMKLDKLQKEVMYFINKGTPFDQSLGDDGDHKPITISIPPTKGIEKLKANRLYADEQLEKGFREDVTSVYLIPWPEYEKMVAVDIEGSEWSKYSRPMKDYEIAQHGKPILKESTTLMEAMEEQGLRIERVDGKKAIITVDETKKEKRKNKKNLLDDDPSETQDAGEVDPDQPI